MSKTTISIYQLFELIPDAETARVYLEKRLWPDGATCPTCKQRDRITVRKGGYYRCNACKEDFTVRTNTIFGRSHIPLHKWVYGMYMLVTARKGISSMQLAKEIGITQKSAWFMLSRLREACGGQLDQLRGTIEIDEAYFGGKEENKHESKKLKQGRGAVGKIPVLGMRERNGRARGMVIRTPSIEQIQGSIYASVELGATIYTDTHGAYNELNSLFYNHASVNHSTKEFVRGDVHTNGQESVWAVMKRGVYGVYHHVSQKHMGRYVNEFTFRLNEGNVKRHTLDRLDSFIAATSDKRITYEELTA